MAALAKVDRQGRLTLPEEIRKALPIEQGDLFEVALVSAAGTVVLTPVTLKPKPVPVKGAPRPR